MKYDEYGRELPDDTPLELGVKFKRPPSIQELIAMHVKAAMQVERAQGKREDDEDDFEEDGEFDDILTPYELHAYAGEADAELRRAKAADEIVQKARKGKTGEKGTAGEVKGNAEEQTPARGAGGSGKESKGAEGAGSKVAAADSGGARGVAEG